MATHALRKASHALAEEGELLNVYSELKDIANAYDLRCKLQERAVKTLVQWTQRRKEDDRIQQLVASLGDVDIEASGVDRRFNDQYRAFVKLWKTVLAEKKELNAKVQALKRGQKQAEQVRKKCNQAELKQPRDEEKLLKAKAQLVSIEQQCQELRKEMEDKVLEVQQDKHQCLRLGYTSLYNATMTRFKDQCLLQEKVRDLLNAFPVVTGRLDDSTFTFEEYTGPKVERPIWDQGEEFYARLQVVKAEHDRIISEQQAKHAETLRNLSRNQELTEAQKNESYSAEMVGIMQQNKAVMKELQETQERQAAEAAKRLEDAKAAHAEEVRKLASDIDRVKEKLEGKLKELASRYEVENKLEEEIDGLKAAIVTRAKAHAHAQIESSGACATKTCADFFFDRVADAQLAQAELARQSQDGQPEEDFADAASAFSLSVTETIMAAWGLVRSSQAESATTLLENVSTFNKVSITVLGLRSGKVSNHIPDNGNESEPEEEKEEEGEPAVAMYDHAENAQGGIKLIGFTKGTNMRILREREDGWSKVVIEGREGWAPSSYMKKIPAAQAKAKLTPAAAGAPTDPKAVSSAFKSTLEDMIRTARDIVKRDKEIAALSNATVDGLGSKVGAAQQAIMDMKTYLEKLGAEVSSKYSGRHLEVNNNVLQLATQLNVALNNIIHSATGMRSALEASKGAEGDSEFNQRHAQWFNGLSSAVDVVAEGVPMLTEALRSVLRRQGKHEEAQVSARNISASVAQLAALSRNKVLSGEGDDGSQHLLSKHSEAFITTSHEFLLGIRECHELELASVVLNNFDELSANDVKRLLMATQVNVLKKEKELELEHEKLRSLRRIQARHQDSSEVDA